MDQHIGSNFQVYFNATVYRAGVLVSGELLLTASYIYPFAQRSGCATSDDPENSVNCGTPYVYQQETPEGFSVHSLPVGAGAFRFRVNDTITFLDHPL